MLDGAYAGLKPKTSIKACLQDSVIHEAVALPHLLPHLLPLAGTTRHTTIERLEPFGTDSHWIAAFATLDG